MTIKQTIKKYNHELKEVTHIPSKEIEILIMYLLDKNIIWLHLNYDKEFEKENELQKIVKKRATHYPIEYIIGKASFYGEQFLTCEQVLIPRPETEILVDKAKDILENIQNPKVIEIGTGSGIISVMLALLIDNIKITAIDINDKALELAQKNAIKFKVDHKIDFIKSDLFDNVSEVNYDMCISNPPYIANNYKLPYNVKFEPGNALFGGEVGDELLNNIISITYESNIKYLCCEMGYDQREPLAKLLKSLKSKKIEFYKDYSDFDRGFCVEFNK
ncbi:protein-(glutamine-N5) methyltransferase, release factor-specific [Arcobacter sp. 31_11_sub10_T18]|nr:protein-(glutamine-N5) methyltransferase, release factor-specific [Arcobacter sp. 31_11_sub10_T18]